MEMRAIRGLLIDIDDTITRYKRQVLDAEGRPPPDANFSSCLQSAGVELGGLTPEESAARIERVKTRIAWWHWSDFIVELELHPRRFWEYAYRREAQYMEAVDPRARYALRRLQTAGLLLYIASNNPDDGILHKLRLAGVADQYHTSLFTQLLGVSAFQYMKWDVLYWKKALAHIGLGGEEVAVVGDSPRDDYEVPRAAGIAGSFLLTANPELLGKPTDSLIYVRNFKEIADCLLKARRSAGVRRTARRRRRTGQGG